MVSSIERRLRELSASSFDHTHILAIAKEEAKAHNIKLGDCFNLLRYMLTGKLVGAPMPHTMQTLGKETVMRRLEKTSNLLQ